MRLHHALFLTLLGCARTVVEPHTAVAAHEPRPDKIIVFDFAVSADDVSPEDGIAIGVAKKSDAQLGHAVAEALAERLVHDLREEGFVVERKPRGTAVGRHMLAIRGEFLTVDEGSQVKRLVIGFGSGESKVDTAIHVYDGARKKLVDFHTHSDSGKMPGAAATMGGGVAVGGAVTGTMVATNAASGSLKEYNSAVERMAAKTADQAARYLSEYFGSQGWIPADRVRKAKID
jgi:hypothetical protein